MQSSGLAQVLDLITKANEIFSSMASWQVKYDSVFALKIKEMVLDQGYGFEYEDPDLSVKEELTSYIEALNKFRCLHQQPQFVSFSLVQSEIDAIYSLLWGLEGVQELELSDEEIVTLGRKHNVPDEKDFVAKCKRMGIGP